MNASVNDGIDRDMSSISYLTTDQIVDGILHLGRGALMAKVDINISHSSSPPRGPSPPGCSVVGAGS